MEIGNPVSKHEFWKHFGRIAKLSKHVGSLIRFFRFYVAQNSEIVVFEVSALKSLRTIKLSYCDEQKPKPLLIFWIWLFRRV